MAVLYINLPTSVVMTFRERKLNMVKPHTIG